VDHAFRALSRATTIDQRTFSRDPKFAILRLFRPFVVDLGATDGIRVNNLRRFIDNSGGYSSAIFKVLSYDSFLADVCSTNCADFFARTVTEFSAKSVFKMDANFRQLKSLHIHSEYNLRHHTELQVAQLEGNKDQADRSNHFRIRQPNRDSSNKSHEPDRSASSNP
jgi:hypothetical protein